MFKGNIDETIGGMIQGGWLKNVPEPERTQTIEETRLGMQKALGLDQPYLLRSVRWLWYGLTLNLGDSRAVYFFTEDTGEVQDIVLAHIPYTMVLIGAANVLVFIASISLALVLSREPNSLANRVTMILTPLSTTPSWIFGIFLILIFVTQLKLLPYPKAIEISASTATLDYYLFVLKSMILPVLAVFLSTFFIGLYSWRTFFSIYANEDYVEIAKAKGFTQ